MIEGPQVARGGAASLGYGTFVGGEQIQPELSKYYVNHAIRVADLAAFDNCRLTFNATAVTDDSSRGLQRQNDEI
mgnify:CR=1 FL=1